MKQIRNQRSGIRKLGGMLLISAFCCMISYLPVQAATATDCTLYASASGNDNNTGTSSNAAKTFLGAAAAAQPGAVVCLLGGTYNLSSTFYPPRSGTPTAWIVYKAYGDSPANLLWTAGPNSQAMVHFYNATFPRRRV